MGKLEDRYKLRGSRGWCIKSLIVNIVVRPISLASLLQWAAAGWILIQNKVIKGEPASYQAYAPWECLDKSGYYDLLSQLCGIMNNLSASDLNWANV